MDGALFLMAKTGDEVGFFFSFFVFTQLFDHFQLPKIIFLVLFGPHLVVVLGLTLGSVLRVHSFLAVLWHYMEWQESNSGHLKAREVSLQPP